MHSSFSQKKWPQSHKHPRVLSIVCENLLSLNSINSPTRFAHRGINFMFWTYSINLFGVTDNFSVSLLFQSCYDRLLHQIWPHFCHLSKVPHNVSGWKEERIHWRSHQFGEIIILWLSIHNDVTKDGGGGWLVFLNTRAYGTGVW